MIRLENPKHQTIACFIVQCCYCEKELSRTIRPDLRADRVSHGICSPVCEPAKRAGWGAFVKGGGQ